MSENNAQKQSAQPMNDQPAKAQQAESAMVRMRETVAQKAALNEPEKIKDGDLSFNDGQNYIGLSMVSYLNKETGTYGDPVPKLTVRFNDQFINLPINGKWWKSFNEFTAKMADALDGVNYVVGNIKGSTAETARAFASLKD